MALGDVADFVRGVTFKPGDVKELGAPGTVACLRTANVQTELSLEDVWAIPETLAGRPDQGLRRGDVLVSSANSWNLVGKCSWVGDLPWRATFGGFVTTIRARPDRLDPRYFFRWFSSPTTQAVIRSFGRRTTNISNLNLDRCRRLTFRLPPLEEQRRIAAILDAADELRAKRRGSLSLLDSLTESIFVDMFGDPLSGGSQWHVGCIGDLVERFEAGKSVDTNEADAAVARYRVLKVSAITSGRYRGEESKPVPPAYEPPQEHFVRRGDLLFSRANTEALVGASALVDEDRSGELLSDKLWRFVWRDNVQVVPLYVWSYLQRSGTRRAIGSLATGTSGSMKNISQAKLMTVPIPVPPLSLQLEFADRRSQAAVVTRSGTTSLHAFDSLFSSLQHRAFRGEL
ncbi:MAG TPA: restriction endonuclease subunit S [Acidimicrobiales bacterium]|nr:restriction endonuclease subunit S [Acidimicrobiales bacterium]